MAAWAVAELDHGKRREAWLEANDGGEITCDGGVFTATLGGAEIARRPHLGRLMDRLDYLGYRDRERYEIATRPSALLALTTDTNASGNSHTQTNGPRGRPARGAPPPMPGEPTLHGVQDVWLGGSSHLHADRELAQRIAARFPSVPVLVNAASDFHLRAAAWCAQQGVERFVRLGTATMVPDRNVHDAARRVNPRARVAYMARLTDALAIAEGLTSEESGTAAFQGAANDPAGVLAAAPVAQMLAGGEPACLIFGLVLHFMTPADAAEAVAEYAAALPRGSFIAMSVMVTADRKAAREFRGMFTFPPHPLRAWDVADVGRALTGLEMVPPGVAEVQEWPARTQWAGPPLIGEIPVRIVGAVARKP